MPQSTGLDVFAVVADTVNTAFGEPAVLQKPGAAAVDIEGVFDGRHYALEFPDGGVGVSAYTVTFGCRRDAIGAEGDDTNLEGATLTVRGAVYRVVDTRPDSESWIVLALTRLQNPDPA